MFFLFLVGAAPPCTSTGNTANFFNQHSAVSLELASKHNVQLTHHKAVKNIIRITVGIAIIDRINAVSF